MPRRRHTLGIEHPEEELAVRERTRSRTPRLFRVLLHNDDFTTVEFVVAILIRHFRKSESEARQVTLQVHHHGVGTAGVYPRDIAETKADQVMQAARAEGFPLRLSTEPEQ